jgi:hypothetical protein
LGGRIDKSPPAKLIEWKCIKRPNAAACKPSGASLNGPKRAQHRQEHAGKQVQHRKKHGSDRSIDQVKVGPKLAPRSLKSLSKSLWKATKSIFSSA